MRGTEYAVSDLPKEVAVALCQLAKAAEMATVTAACMIDIKLRELFEKSDLKKQRLELSTWKLPAKGQTVLYRISCDSKEIQKTLSGGAKEMLDDRKANTCKVSGFSMARLNGLKKTTKALYVGRSNNICKRMEWHLGLSQPGTYAMHLIRWCPTYAQKALNAVITLECWKVTLGVQADRVVQELEDKLWDWCQPLFGKRGGH